MASERSSSRPAEVFGRYTLYGEVASGGMASVHVGRLSGQAGFARTVAIKRLHPQYAKDPEFVAMFLDEARLASRIRHPNVVPTLDVVALSGELLVVMDYIHGESFSKLLRTCRKQRIDVPLRVVAAVMTNVLHGLHAAHEARTELGEPLAIVHRDVSPQNVLVGLDGVAYVLDFGVAMAASRAQTTREGLLKGKIAYMAPEQIGLQPVDRRTDIYAAGVVLWEALAGRRLFEADNDFALAEAIRTAKVDPPSKHRAMPPGFDSVTLRAMSRDPAARFATAREMANALEECTGVASAREVADWVSSIAGEVLHERSEMVSGVEKQTARTSLAGEDAVTSPTSVGTPLFGDPSARPATDEPNASRGSPSEPPTVVLQPLPVEEATRSVVHTLAKPAPTSGYRHLVIAGAVSCVLVILLGGVLLYVARRSDDSAVAALRAPPSVTADVTATSAPSTTSLPTIAASNEQTSIETVSSSAEVKTASSPTPSAARPQQRAKPAATHPPPKPDCADPFYMDDKGIKRIKRQCVSN